MSSPGAGAPTQRRIGAGIDVGGTFTDIVVASGSRPRALKVSTTPTDQSQGLADGLAVAGVRDTVKTIVHGTTTATNAVLERDIARTVFVVTDGFRDLLSIGRQDRPSLYDLTKVKTPHLVEPDLVVPVVERMGPDGRPVIDLTADEISRVVARVRALEPESVAITFLFSYAGREHEERLATALRSELDVPVTVSSEILPEYREYERASTAVLNAAVQPVMSRYLAQVAERVPSATFAVMTSGGGTVSLQFATDRPVHTLLSGPAAGVVAAAKIAAMSGFPDALALDMGGTSTDVCLIRNGQPEITAGGRIGSLPFRTPAVDITTVGAGGGSIARIDRGGALRVGPESAGAQPGPACYGRGGTAPTVTDAHCALNHLGAGSALGGSIRLDRDAAERAIAALPASAQGPGGILAVVRATMARALRSVSTERGVDPSTLALVAYGGAGPLQATALARQLGCAAVIVPPAPGVLSALGLLLAPSRFEVAQTAMATIDTPLRARWEELERQAADALRRQGVTVIAKTTWLADCRYAGQSHELRIEVSDEHALAKTFEEAHEEAYGYRISGEEIQIVNLRVVLEGHPLLTNVPTDWDQGSSEPETTRRIGMLGGWVDARVIHRAALKVGDELSGPALIEQPDTTTLLSNSDVATVDPANNLVVSTHGN